MTRSVTDTRNAMDAGRTRKGHAPAVDGAPAKPTSAYSTDRMSLSSGATTLTWSFKPQALPGFYDASGEHAPSYDIPAIKADIPGLWKGYGPLFKHIGAEMGVDPYALAAYCVFESYNSKKHAYNPHALDIGGGMVAAGLAATQAQDWKGRPIPGVGRRFPASIKATADLLRRNPEYGVRCLAAEMRDAKATTGGDLAKVFPYVAFPAWGNAKISRGAYGTQAQYVSRAYVFYQAFKQADQAGSRG